MFCRQLSISRNQTYPVSSSAPSSLHSSHTHGLSAFMDPHDLTNQTTNNVVTVEETQPQEECPEIKSQPDDSKLTGTELELPINQSPNMSCHPTSLLQLQAGRQSMQRPGGPRQEVHAVAWWYSQSAKTWLASSDLQFCIRVCKGLPCVDPLIMAAQLSL
mmetsp:Transcript_14318/g.25002  ORF Transcript_14318/g.25002 Transcript_14318/m.25002 type:complete len:160 (-) Transcript_14318:42-521(-)